MPAASGPADSMSSVILGWGEYLHKKTTMTELHQRAGDEMSGWFWQNDTLYARRRLTAASFDPTGAGKVFTSYWGSQDAQISVQRRNWHISNLTLRYCGAGTAANGHAISIGTTGGVTGAGTTVDSCRFYGNTGSAVYAPGWAGGARGDSVWVLRSLFDGLNIGRMAYQAAKTRLEENSGLVSVRGRRPIIWNNTFQNLPNGLNVGDGTTTPGDTNMAYCGTIINNVFRYISDDAIELDSNYGINLLVMNNNARYVLSGISCAPIFSGPTFILFNVVSQYGFAGNGRGLKIGATNGYGKVLFWNNTITTSGTSTSHGVEFVGGIAQGLSIQNNVITTAGTSAAYVFNFAALNDSTNNGTNYNRTWTSAGTNSFANWNTKNKTFALLRSAPGWEKQGSNVHFFADTSRANYALTLHAAARRISGVDTDYQGIRYIGTGPDAGAIMFGWPRRGVPAVGRAARGRQYKELE